MSTLSFSNRALIPDFIHQVGILLRELCRLHNVPLPPDIDNLALPLQTPPPSASPLRLERSAGGGVGGGVGGGAGPHGNEETDSDQDEIEDPIGESEQESEGDEDLPLEMDDVRNTNKVRKQTSKQTVIILINNNQISQAER